MEISLQNALDNVAQSSSVVNMPVAVPVAKILVPPSNTHG
jgi:phosphoribosylcarboxyaminoimidazole (NCAIR) mutase